MKHLEYLNITPKEVRQWCDNERSVINSMEAPTRIGGMIKANADLILAIHHLKNNLKFSVDCRHMYGHQDGKNKKKQEKREAALDAEIEGYTCETEVESSESEAEAMMMRTFQIGEKRQPELPQKMGWEQNRTWKTKSTKRKG